jgi:hypothetical protein
VGVLVGVKVAVGNVVGVTVRVGTKVGAIEVMAAGVDANDAMGVQAALSTNKIRRIAIRRCMGIPPCDEMNCCYNGIAEYVVPEFISRQQMPTAENSQTL